MPTAPPDLPVPPAQPQPSKQAQAPKVRWKGDLVLYSGGWPAGLWLDDVPPSKAAVGDLNLVCDCHPGEIDGRSVVVWEEAHPPSFQDCSVKKGLMASRSLAVRPGYMACLQTGSGRLGYLTVTAVRGPADFELAVTVWDAG
ncbi:hypothetical protein [Streptomyces sp. NPDC048659]|uniref:hypothetical protein n=1 Tax=Streptomyces sp. NPDC048659 TaxID=3155489 RepID=UPI003427CB34